MVPDKSVWDVMGRTRRGLDLNRRGAETPRNRNGELEGAEGAEDCRLAPPGAKRFAPPGFRFEPPRRRDAEEYRSANGWGQSDDGIGRWSPRGAKRVAPPGFRFGPPRRRDA